MPLIVKNMLVRHADATATYRIVDIINADDIQRDDAVDYAVLIDMASARALSLTFRKVLEIVELIADKEWRVTEETRRSVDLGKLTPAEARILERRWSLIQQVTPKIPQLYLPGVRAAFARELAAQRIATRAFLYQTLALYFRGGCVKEALVPGFRFCGALGQDRIPKTPAGKAGRKRFIQPGVGLALTPEHRQNMVIVLEGSSIKNSGKGLERAYNYLLKRFYPQWVTVDPKHPDARPKIDAPDCVPSFDQFFYAWRRQYDLGRRLRLRRGARGFEKLTRLLLSGTLKEVRGPGTRYYIDATVLDVYVVSRFDPNRIITRPTLYVVVDEFSRLIVGIYVGLEPPCWVGAMLALWNCNVDKVDFCAKYGLEIAPEWWPTGYMPLHLMGDRGELASQQAEALAKGFRFDVENAAPYRGDAKGVVERTFPTVQRSFGPWLPGWVDPEPERGSDPPALRAALTLPQITGIMCANAILANHRVISGYEGAPEQIVDGVAYSPIPLWNWGVRNLRQEFRRYSDDYLVRYLWPEHKLKLDRKGLKFHRGLWYMGMNLQEQPWFLKALLEHQEFSARFHPTDLEQLFLLPNEPHKDMLPIDVTVRSAKFASGSLSELAALERRRDRQNAAKKWDNRPVAATMDGFSSKIVQDAKANMRLLRDESLSKAERLAARRRNRDEEIAADSADALSAALGASMPSSTSPDQGHAKVELDTIELLEEVLERGA